MSKKRKTSATNGTIYVLCPFFRTHGTKEIICEGLFDGCTCGMKFATNEKKEFHKQNYCEKHYERCEYYLSAMHWRWPDE